MAWWKGCLVEWTCAVFKYGWGWWGYLRRITIDGSINPVGVALSRRSSCCKRLHCKSWSRSGHSSFSFQVFPPEYIQVSRSVKVGKHFQSSFLQQLRSAWVVVCLQPGIYFIILASWLLCAFREGGGDVSGAQPWTPQTKVKTLLWEPPPGQVRILHIDLHKWCHRSAKSTNCYSQSYS